MEEKKSRLEKAGAWFQNHFSAWFANSFVMAGVFMVIVASMFIGMEWDGEYAARWAPHPNNEWQFRWFGRIISLFMIFGTAVGIKARQEGSKAAGNIFIALGVFATLISVTQSVGVVASRAQEMTAKAEAYEDASNKVATADKDRLTELKAQREEQKVTRDNEINRLESSIEDIRDDGVDGVHSKDLEAIDVLQTRIDETRDKYQEKIDSLSNLILNEMQTPQADEADNPVMKPQKFDPLIDVLGWMLTWGNPTDSFKAGLTIVYLFLWSTLCPLFGQMLSCYLVITRHNSGAARNVGKRYTIDGQEVTEEELAHAMQKHRNQQEGAKKAQETKSLLKTLGDVEWKRQMLQEAREMHKEGFSFEEMAKRYSMTIHEYTGQMRRFAPPVELSEWQLGGKKDEQDS